jgi:hypothetical protein
MLIKCPACGASASLDALIDDEPAAQALMLALKLSPVGRSLVRYLGLFRPAKRQLSWSKVVTLLGELTPMIESQRISRNGVVYEVPMAVWEVAIDKVLMMRDSGKLATPLKSHGYLLEIIVTEAGKNLPVVQLVEGVDAMNRVSTKPLSATAQAIINLEARKQGASHVAG